MAQRSTHDRKQVYETVLQGLTDGASLRSTCAKPGMPAASTVCGWLADDPAFAEQYARAREAAGQLVGEEIEEIARRVLAGEIEPNAARVAIDALKWSAARKAPRVYGDRVGLDVSCSSNTIDLGAILPARPLQPDREVS